MQKNKEYMYFLCMFYVLVFVNFCWCVMYINMNELGVYQFSYIVYLNNQKLSKN